MKTFIIAKLDTPCTLTKEVAHLPAAEPINFANMLCEASEEPIHVVMLGLTYEREVHKNRSIIEVHPYYSKPSQLKSLVDEDTTLFIWQGRHIIDVNLPSNPNVQNARIAISKPKDPDYYEKISYLKLWQVSMYNLVASSVMEPCKKYAIVTDLRLPLLDMNKVDSEAVPSKLPKDITLLTQAYQHEAYMKWHNKFGHGIPFPETSIEPVLYKFEKSTYLPMHSLPIWSHGPAFEEYAKVYKDFRKQGTVCQVQSLKYMDDVRIKQLSELIDRCEGNVVLQGRFGAHERALISSKFPKYAQQLLAKCEGKAANPLPYFVAAKELCKFERNLVVTDGRYSRFGLIPNRFVESLATFTEPVFTDAVTKFSDETSKSIAKQLTECKTRDEFEHIAADELGHLKAELLTATKKLLIDDEPAKTSDEA